MIKRMGLLSLLGVFIVEGALADTLLVGNKSAASVSLIDLETGKEVARAATGDGPHEIAVSSDGKLAVVTNYGTDTPGNTLTVIEVEQGKSVGTIDLGEYTRPHGIVFMPGNRRVLVTAEGKKVLLQVDVWQGKVEKAVPTGQETSHMLAYDPAGKRAYVSNLGSASVSLINVAAGELLSIESTGAGAEGIALGNSGRDLWVTNRGQDTVSLLDSSYLKSRARIEVPGFPIRVEVMDRRHGGQVLVTSARSAELTIIDPEKPAIERVLPIGLEGRSGTIFGDRLGDSSIPIGIEIDPSGKRVWIAHAAANAVQELDTGNWEETRVLTGFEEPDAMAYSPLPVSGPE